MHIHFWVCRDMNPLFFLVCVYIFSVKLSKILRLIVYIQTSNVNTLIQNQVDIQGNIHTKGKYFSPLYVLQVHNQNKLTVTYIK